MEYIIDLKLIDKTLTQEVNQIAQDMKLYFSQKTLYSDCIVLLHAWKTAANNTCCAFAEIGKRGFNIFFCRNDEKHFWPMMEREIELSSFYLSEKEDLRSEIICGWLCDESEPKEFDHIWDALMRLYPDYTAPTVKYEKYVPYNLDHIVGADKYLNAGTLFRMIETNNTKVKFSVKYEEWNISNQGKEDEQRYLCNASYSGKGCNTPKEFEEYVKTQNERPFRTALLSVEHKTYYLDTPLSEVSSRMGATYSCREIHIFQSNTDTTYISLNTVSIYFGHPMEGGTMGGYIFSKIMEVPAEEYNFSREQVIEKYETKFN